MSKNNERTHIIKRDKGWAIRQEGALKATKVFSTQKEAIESAKNGIAQGRDLVIHRMDGTILTWKKIK